MWLVRARAPRQVDISVVLTATVTEPTDQVTSHSLPQPPNGSESAVVKDLRIPQGALGREGQRRERRKVLGGLGGSQGQPGEAQVTPCLETPTRTHQDTPGMEWCLLSRGLLGRGNTQGPWPALQEAPQETMVGLWKTSEPPKGQDPDLASFPQATRRPGTWHKIITQENAPVDLHMLRGGPSEEANYIQMFYVGL